MFENKRFQSNETQEIVTVVGDNGVFYSLSNGANIKKDIFFQKYSEMIDASYFFQQQSAAGLQDLAEKLRNVDSSKVNDIGGSDMPSVKVRQESMSEQVQVPLEYRDMLLKRYQQEQQNKDLSQYKVYENEDEAADDWERKVKATQQPQRPRQRPQPPRIENPQQPVAETMPVMESAQPVQQQQYQAPAYVSQEEETFRFFKGFKRIYPIKLSVDFDERIAEPNFLRMMVMNMEGDIIKYYTKEIMNRIYNDPGYLENKIYEKLRSIVFEEEQKKEESKPKAVKISKPKSPQESNPKTSAKITKKTT
jgi:hypothetical protein